MFAAVAILGLIGAAAVAAGLVLFARYGARDLLVLAVLGFISLYLSRFDDYLQATIAGRPLIGFHFFLIAACLALGAARLVVREAPRLEYGWIVALLSTYAGLSIASGLANGGKEGLAAAVQILIISLGPCVLAATLVDLVPRTEAASSRLRVSFLLLIGVMTPALQLASSVAPNLLGALLGWTTAASGAAGFVRGGSPLGGSIATGAVEVLAYGLAMHEVVARRRKRYIPVLILVGVSVLFTLARSVLLMLILFHLFYFWSVIRRYPLRIAGLALAGFIVMTPLLVKLEERFSFERFLETGDASAELRGYSAKAALRASVRRPVLGGGPGLIYDEIRTDWLVDASALAAKKNRVKIVGDSLSAFEPHNLYLLLAAEHGWPAALAFTGAFFVVWRRMRGLRRGLHDDRASQAAAFAAVLAAMGAMFLTFSGPLVNPQGSVFLWFFVFSGLHFRASVFNATATRRVEETLLMRSSLTRKATGDEPLPAPVHS